MNNGNTTTCWKSIGTWGDRSCPELKPHVHCRNCPVYAAGAAKLLDVEVSADYLAEQTHRYAQRKELARPGEHSVVIFRLAGEWLALSTSVFSEVASQRRVHSLPHRRDRAVLGVVNIRGELLVCVSVATALGVTDASGTGPDTRLAVINRDGDRFVFPADEIAGLHRFDNAQLAPVPATLAHAQAKYTRGILPWQGHSVGVLDDQLLFYTLNHSLA
jgi:chemotaxis-related protein WspD